MWTSDSPWVEAYGPAPGGKQMLQWELEVGAG
jgi:hypothetical protein